MLKKRLRPITQSHYIVEVQGLPKVFFTEFSGINEKTQVIKVPDGQRLREYPVLGLTSVEPVTLSVNYDPEVHASVVEMYRRLRDSGEIVQITVSPIRDGNDPAPVGASYRCSGCMVTGIEVATVQRGSNEVSKLTLTFEYDEFSYS